jgi:hypothetical protein
MVIRNGSMDEHTMAVIVALDTSFLDFTKAFAFFAGYSCGGGKAARFQRTSLITRRHRQ